MRARRWAELLRVFPELPEMRVLDVGGEPRFWRDRAGHPASVTLLNTVAQTPSEPWLDAVEGDGCALPSCLGDYDLVFSNSVIEHVGGHWRRQRFAEQVRSAAPRYWVQTPYRYFPIEPHFVFPFLQYLPLVAQGRLAARWPFSNGGPQDRDVALRLAAGIDLLSFTQMRLYFPDADLTVLRAHQELDGGQALARHVRCSGVATPRRSRCSGCASHRPKTRSAIALSPDMLVLPDAVLGRESQDVGR